MNIALGGGLETEADRFISIRYPDAQKMVLHFLAPAIFYSEFSPKHLFAADIPYCLYAYKCTVENIFGERHTHPVL